MITFEWVVKNTGRSPAWITGGVSRARKIPKDSLPEQPDYGGAYRITLTPHPPNEQGTPEFARIRFSGDEFRALNEGKLNFVVSGFFTYRDALGKEHETRCCMCLEPGPSGLAMSMCGPEAYNRYT